MLPQAVISSLPACAATATCWQLFLEFGHRSDVTSTWRPISSPLAAAAQQGTIQIDGMNVGFAFNGGGVAGFATRSPASEVQMTTRWVAEVDRGGPRST